MTIPDGYLETMFGAGCRQRVPRGAEGPLRTLAERLWERIGKDSDPPEIILIDSPRARPFILQRGGKNVFVHDMNLGITFYTMNVLETIAPRVALVERMIFEVAAERLLSMGDLNKAGIFVMGNISQRRSKDVEYRPDAKEVIVAQRAGLAQTVFAIAHELVHVALKDRYRRASLYLWYQRIFTLLNAWINSGFGIVSNRDHENPYLAKFRHDMLAEPLLPYSSPRDITDLWAFLSASVDESPETPRDRSLTEEGMCDFIGAVATMRLLSSEGYTESEVMAQCNLALAHLSLLQLIDMRLAYPGDRDKSETFMRYSMARRAWLKAGLAVFVQTLDANQLGSEARSEMMRTYRSETANCLARFKLIEDHLMFGIDFERHLHVLLEFDGWSDLYYNAAPDTSWLLEAMGFGPDGIPRG